MAREVDKVWEEPYGDRRQEIVVIGVKMDRAVPTAALDAALVTEEELAQGPEAWSKWADEVSPAPDDHLAGPASCGSSREEPPAKVQKVS